MDSQQSPQPLVLFLKSHPLILVSLAFSAGAFLFASASLSHAPFVESSDSAADSELPKQVVPTIIIDVEGEVMRPGIIKLELAEGKDLRIGDALDAAGGLLPSADTEYVQHNLNLAAVVSDGMKLYVPKIGATQTQTANETAPGRINVNTAPENQLTQLKGIGESRAQNIIKNRPYMSLEDLKTKAKLPASIIEDLEDDITF